MTPRFFVVLVIAIVGALIYALSTNTKAAELGRITFACALLVWIAHAVSLL